MRRGASIGPGAVILIRRAPCFGDPRVVVVTGEVSVPGAYVLASCPERLVDLVQRTGGPTQQAHPSIEAGDTRHRPSYDPTDLITGAVAFETRAPYERGRSMDYYMRQAGGYTCDADRSRVSVTSQNGEREVVDRCLPDVRPVPSIHVPLEPKHAGFSGDRFLTQALAIASTAATVAIAVAQIN